MTIPKQKLTPEQKAERKALKQQQLEQAQLEYNAYVENQVAEYKLGLPKRLMVVTADANKCDITTDVRLTETGPSIRFTASFPNQYIDTTLTYNSEEWEVECFERTVRSITEEKNASAARKECAQAAWNNLDVHQRACIIEFLHYLK